MYRFSAGFVEMSPRLEPVASPYPAIPSSFRLASRAHCSSTRQRIGSAASLTCSFTDVSSLAERSLSDESIPRYGRCLSSIVS